MSGCQATPAVGAGLDAREYLSSEAQRLLRETAALPSMEARELCRVRWLIYRGDENYGLGNVLYDVASAAALALALNRTLVYGADAVDRKFGTLLQWPGLLTMRDADELRRRAQCHPERWQLSAQRRVVFAPDKCTFQRTWRRERSGKGRCFKRLLGIDWLEERAPVIELSKVHAFTGLQTLLKSAHAPLRERVRALTGGCLLAGSRPNLHGVILASLMQPSPAVLHAVRWALSQQQQQQRQHAHESHGWTAGRLGKSRYLPWTPPQIGLHVRAMNDHRAKNLTGEMQAVQMQNALICIHRAAKAMAAKAMAAAVMTAAAAPPTGASHPSSYTSPARDRRDPISTHEIGSPPAFLSVLVISSSPELRTLMVR